MCQRSEATFWHSVNEGLGKDFYRNDNSVKRLRQFSEPPDSRKWEFSALITLPKLSFFYGIVSRIVLQSCGAGRQRKTGRTPKMRKMGKRWKIAPDRKLEKWLKSTKKWKVGPVLHFFRKFFGHFFPFPIRAISMFSHLSPFFGVWPVFHCFPPPIA